jgi:hypothetical protein
MLQTRLAIAQKVVGLVAAIASQLPAVEQFQKDSRLPELFFAFLFGFGAIPTQVWHRSLCQVLIPLGGQVNR